jgi:HEAT repeat protein
MGSLCGLRSRPLRVIFWSPMKSSRAIVAGLCAVLAGGLFFVWRFRTAEPVEPEYRGVQMSRWFARFCLRNRAQMRMHDSLGALRGMGTNTVAYLVQLVDPTNHAAFARIELQAQREIGSGDSPLARMERTLLTMMDAEADPRRVLLVEPARVQDEAYQVLVLMQPPAGTLLPLLAGRLQHPSPAVREHALGLLGCIGSQAELTHPFLIAGLADDSEDCRAAAADAIAAAGKSAKALVAPLIAAFNRSSTKTRARVAWALGRMGPDAREALPAMIAMLDADNSPYHRIMTAGAVYRIDASQPNAFAALIDGLVTPSFRRVALGELGALWKIRTNAQVDAMPVLERIVAGDRDPSRRILAAQLVTEWEPTHAAALSVLVAAMGDRTLRRDVAPVLATLRPVPAVPASLLVSSLGDDDLLYDRNGLEVLLGVGDQKAEAVAATTQSLESPLFRVRVNAAACLLRLEPGHPGAIAVLTHYLQQAQYPGWVVRAADGFSVAGTNAAAAAPALMAAQANVPPLVADVIRFALERVAPTKADAAAR